LELEVSAFTKTDSTNAHETVNKIQPGELVIRDLGYISIENMKAISRERNAYYLNRLKSSTVVFKTIGNKPERFNFSQIESKMRKGNIRLMETKAYIGEDQKYPVRMIINLVSEQVKEERVRERRKYAKKKKQTVNKETLARCGLNVFITNADEDLLPTKLVPPIYGIRWQIENIFKVWKSVGGIHKVKKISKERFEFYLYSKLVFFIKSWQAMQIIELATNATISYYKYLKVVSISGFNTLELLFKKIIEAVGIDRFLLKEYRQNRINEISIKKLINSCISTI